MERTSIQKIIRLWLGRQTRQRDEQALKTWLVSSKDADEKREACFGEWQQMNVAGDPKATREALSRFQERRDAYEDRLQRRRRLMRVLSVAASVALLVVCGTAIWFGSLHYYHSGDTKLAELIVPEDGLDSITLSDGTKVFVNGGTALYYPQSFNTRLGTRDVYLLGEANFKVAKDKEHPFIVHAGRLNVQAVGTKFNVKAYPGSDSIITTMEEGLIKVYDGKFTALMRPNDQMVYRRGLRKVSRGRVTNLAQVNSWTLGDLDFNDASLTDIVNAISRHYNVDIAFDYAVDPNKRYNMHFRHNEPLGSVLDVITLMGHDLHYSINGRLVTLYHGSR